MAGTTSCELDGGWAVTLDFSSSPEGQLTLLGNQTNVAGTATSPDATKILRKDTALCSPVNSRSASPFAGGTGDAGDPFLVCTAAQLAAVGSVGSAWYALYDDIDLAAAKPSGH